MWYKKKFTMSPEEMRIKRVIDIMCENSTTEVRVDPMTMDFYLTNKENHYDVIITSTSIHITNTVNHDLSTHREGFLDICKTEAKVRAHMDRLKIKNEMLARRNEMLTLMENNLAIRSGLTEDVA
jgi:hypothetical protein